MKNIFRNFHQTVFSLKARFLSILTLLMGISVSVVAQYGAPTSYYKIRGKVLSENCEKPIPKIRVTLPQSKDTTFTNENGEFSIEFWKDEYLFNRNEINLVFEDIDGDKNGRWQSQSSVAKPFYYLKAVGKNPCEQERDSIIIPPPQPISVILQSENDSINNSTTYFRTSLTINLFPNPNQGSFFISFALEKSMTLEMYITDLNGKRLFSKKKNFEAGWINEEFSLSGILPGVYFLNIFGDSIQQSKRFVIH